MVILGLFFSLIIAACGFLLFKHGLRLPTGDEESDRNDSFLYEFLNGPPGYERVRAVVGGIVLIIIGVFGIGYSLLNQL